MTEVERREETFERALGLFLGAFVGCALTALYHSPWWVSPLAAFSLLTYFWCRWKVAS